MVSFLRNSKRKHDFKDISIEEIPDNIQDLIVLEIIKEFVLYNCHAENPKQRICFEIANTESERQLLLLMLDVDPEDWETTIKSLIKERWQTKIRRYLSKQLQIEKRKRELNNDSSKT